MDAADLLHGSQYVSTRCAVAIKRLSCRSAVVEYGDKEMLYTNEFVRQMLGFFERLFEHRLQPWRDIELPHGRSTRDLGEFIDVFVEVGF